MVQLFFLSVKEAEVHSEAPAVFFDSLTILAEE
jgi:hypothetical protein